MRETFMKTKRVLAKNKEGDVIYGIYPYQNPKHYCWFSHYDGNSCETRFLFDDEARINKGYEITTVEEFEILRYDNRRNKK